MSARLPGCPGSVGEGARPSVNGRIVVTGGTGTVGRQVARRLAAAGVAVRVVTRDPRRAARAGVPGELVAADFADRRRLARALAGADSVFVVTSDPRQPAHDENILGAALSGGVRHLVKLSALAVADPAADDLITRWQRSNEERLAAADLLSTVLRPRAFMSNALEWAAGIRREGVVRTLYPDARNACVDPADIAEVAVRVLTVPAFQGGTWALTGPEPLCAREQTEQLARVLGRPLRCEELTPEQACARWRASMPEPMVRARLLSAERQRQGAKEAVLDGVKAVTGRDPGTFARWAERHAGAFR
ncbi:butenolide phosphate reductase ScbC [Streptomyces glaucus]|uniref:Butenolide phosphate reductase ScbC n=1 Tax=Streptomyces glaucus TaxID=284029 RepID=A0ABN3K7B3_9ACTN